MEKKESKTQVSDEDLDNLLTRNVKNLERIKKILIDFARLNNNNKLIKRFYRIHNVSAARLNLEFSALNIILLSDLVVISRSIQKAKNTWETIYFLKQGHLVIYEAIITFNKYNKAFFQLIKTRYPSLIDTYESICKNLKTFKKQYKWETTIARIRNVTAGHYDEDYLKYYLTVYELRSNNAILAIISFLKILFELNIITRKIIIISTNENQ